LGVYGIIRLGQRSQDSEATELSEGRIYLQFIALTALNPFTIVYFLALITGNGADWDYALADCLWFIFGVGMASLSWQILLAVHRDHRQGTPLRQVPGGHHHHRQHRGDGLGRPDNHLVKVFRP
jgi:arginine exporter protein ArgO